ncbi:MAG TPA: magnesium-translocating P-type ATPase [Burkholderiaceae bacterium]|nr:magnesium-translocating P-type ATPase [Burkholderiaceae bacterium]
MARDSSNAGPTAPWAEDPDTVLAALESRREGLASGDAERRLQENGPNEIGRSSRAGALATLAAQFKSPLLLILVFAAVISAINRDWLDSLIVMTIIAASAALTFTQEYTASRAVEKLLARVSLRARLLRDGTVVERDARDVVPGDIVLLSAGSLVPADGLVLEADDFFVNEAALTGESFPVEKTPGRADAAAGLAQRPNYVCLGTNVRSGTAKVLITATGRRSEFGEIAARLAQRAPETDFERGLRRFGQLLTQVMTLLVLVIFAANVASDRPVTDSLLFAVALAVGLAPELLPAVVSLTLSRGARRMASAGVIVRRLAAMENFGAMTVLATDKTGTLTAGVVRLDGATDAAGQPSEHVLRLAALNARLQTGLPNALDEAICTASRALALDEWTKTEEIPYDFFRKRMTIAVRRPGRDGDTLITKGALDAVLAVCTGRRQGTAAVPIGDTEREQLRERAAAWADAGFRVLGVATRTIESRKRYAVDDEQTMVFEGFLLFFDPPKPDAAEAIKQLKRRGVALKIITGDSLRVAAHVAQDVGLKAGRILTGAELREMHDEALWHVAHRTSIFAEVDPGQKERIIRALRHAGHVVGYLGDGINDAPALHAADVGISVDTAVDVARESADFVLLQHDLTVLTRAIDEGRRVFANTLKYVFTTTSANFGNMISMAALSLVIPFLPLLPKQILLNNFLSDLPAMAIPGDRVDGEAIARPRRWDVATIRNFMLVFGLASSVFDVLTFVFLLGVLHVSPAEFRTAWFVESLLTEVMILLVVRTQRPLWRSAPSPILFWISAAAAGAALALPYLPVSQALFDFVPLGPGVLALLVGITVAYVITNELIKSAFGNRVHV